MTPKHSPTVAELQAEVARLKSTLRLIMAQAGNPDAAEGCRVIIRTAKGALKGQEAGEYLLESV